MKTPHPYQHKLIRDVDLALEKHRAVVVVLPTGGGKTVCIAAMAKEMARLGASVVALAHREELVDQISETFADFEIPHGLIKSGMPVSKGLVQVGMIRTFKNKLHKYDAPDYLFIDECHHTPAAEYAAIIAAMPPHTRIIGVTATPRRLDGKGLGNFYSYMVHGPSLADLISMGFLCAPRVFAPDLIDTAQIKIRFGDFDKNDAAELLCKPEIVGDSIEHYKYIANNTTAVSFCQNINHAKLMASSYNQAGINSMHIDGGMSKPERKDILARFRRRETMILTSADLISEGFDCPGIETIIMLRPTQSESLYLQQVGRGLRIFPGKTHAIILDHVRNTKLHGYPTADREWSLEFDQRNERDKDEDDISIRTCKNCYLVYTESRCPYCEGQSEQRRKNKEIVTRPGLLKEVVVKRNFATRAEALAAFSGLWATKQELEEFADEQVVEFEALRNALIREADGLDQLKRVGRMLGYDSGWAQHRHSSRSKSE